MSAPTGTLNEAATELDADDRSLFERLAKSLGWVAMTGLTVTAATLFGMALSVVAAVGTVVVAAIAVVCLAVVAAIVAVALVIFGALLLLGGAGALTVGVAATVFALLTALLGAVGRGFRALTHRQVESPPPAPSIQVTSSSA